MTKPTHELDDLIREALADDRAQRLEEFEDLSAFAMLTEVFRGRNRLLAALGVVVNLVLFVIGVGAAVAFANEEDLVAMARYGATSALCFGGVLAIKIWYWLEMTRLALIREIKRVELRIAQMDRRTRGQEGR
jgi:hypothetical protein